MFGQTISLLSMIGIAVTLTGIVVVLLEREIALEEKLVTKMRKRWGLLFGVISAMGQGFGLVLSRIGMYAGVTTAINPLSAALMRMLWAGPFVWICVILAGKLPEAQKAVGNRQGIQYTAAGAVVGPFLGMTLSMVAVANAQVGVAQTLMSLMPVFIIPVIWVIYREKTNVRGILGAIVAVVGVAILFQA
jgi:drug/metabolite transporter (DMT)-like permease